MKTEMNPMTTNINTIPINNNIDIPMINKGLSSPNKYVSV